MLASGSIHGRMQISSMTWNSFQSTRHFSQDVPFKVSAKDVKALRSRTSAPMMECKKALENNENDQEKAILWLKQRGAAVAAKKVGRDTTAGLIALDVSNDNKLGILVEMRCETDFVYLCNEVTQNLLGLGGSIQGKTVAEVLEIVPELEGKITDMVGKVRENITFQRFEIIENNHPDGYIGGYVHNRCAPGMGLQGALVSLSPSGEGAANPVNDKFVDDVEKLAMHLVVANPPYMTIADIPKDNEVDLEVGAERCFLDQEFLLDGVGPGRDRSTAAFIRNNLGESFKVESYKVCKLGDVL